MLEISFYWTISSFDTFETIDIFLESFVLAVFVYVLNHLFLVHEELVDWPHKRAFLEYSLLANLLLFLARTRFLLGVIIKRCLGHALVEYSIVSTSPDLELPIFE